MIIRTVKSRNYTVINNTVLEDTRLSWRARGIAAYLLTKPDDWNINHDHLRKSGPEGRDAVLNALSELEKAGYLVRAKIQGKDGRWRTEVQLHETPQVPSPDMPKSVPTTDEPTPGNPVPGESGLLLNTDDQLLISNNYSHAAHEADTLVDATPVVPSPLVSTLSTGESGDILHADADLIVPEENAVRSAGAIKTKRAPTAYVHPDTGVSTADIQKAFTGALEAAGRDVRALNYGEIGRTAKQIASLGYQPEQVTATTQDMLKDAFWKDKPIALSKVKERLSLKGTSGSRTAVRKGPKVLEFDW